MEPRALFLKTLDELASRIEPGSHEYDLVKAAGLLRQLLLERAPLVDLARGRAGAEVRYVVNSPGPILATLRSTPGLTTWSHEDGFDPESAMSRRHQKSVDRDRLLRQVLLISEGHDVTVRDLILFLSHVGGGIHSGVPKTARNQVLARLAASIAIGGYPAGVRSIQAVGRVVIRGLAPLRASVEAELSKEHRSSPNAPTSEPDPR